MLGPDDLLGNLRDDIEVNAIASADRFTVRPRRCTAQNGSRHNRGRDTSAHRASYFPYSPG
jgi:hypothetical protein